MILIAKISRFEPDMLAFSGCNYGGGEKEMRELGAIRKRWKSLHVSMTVQLISYMGACEQLSSFFPLVG